MFQLPKIKYRFEILLAFVIIELYFFKSDSSFKILFTILEYIFLSYSLITNKEIGLMYLISFTILTVGFGNYNNMESLPSNFWGIRVLGFSFNILFSFATFALILTKNKFNFTFKKENNNIFFIQFIICSLIIGVISVSLSINYLDNFFSDLFTYTPIIIYIYFLSFLKLQSVKSILRYTISLTIILLILSSLFNKKFNYGNDYFVLQNGLYFILPIALFLLKDLYSRLQFIILIISLLTLILLKEYILSGKTIIMIVIFIFWIGVYYKKMRKPLLFTFIISICFIDIISSMILQYFTGSVISFKFSQIFDIFIIADFEVMASTFSSMGNLIAEGKTIYAHFTNNMSFLIFGKGFGGGVPDIFGYLAPWAGETGYSEIDLVRNNYYKMHLPIYEILLKSGIIGLILYSYLLYKSFTSKNKYSIIYFCLLFFVFYVSKELILVTLLFLKLVTETDVVNNKIKNDFSINQTN